MTSTEDREGVREVTCNSGCHLQHEVLRVSCAGGSAG
jgi:hypothetical protein